MRQTLTIALVVATLLGSALYAFGDIARPKASPEGKVVLYSGLTVVPDAKAVEARLQISEGTLKNIMDGAARNSNGAESLSQRIMHSSTRTIMAGLFMFLAVSFAGVWLARAEQRRNHKMMAGVLLLAFVFGLATVIVRANAGPPGYIRWQNLPQSLKDGKPTSGGVNIEIVSGDDTIKLIVPLRNSKGPGEE